MRRLFLVYDEELDFALKVTYDPVICPIPSDAIWNALHEYACSEQCYYWCMSRERKTASFGIEDWESVPEHFFEHEGILQIEEYLLPDTLYIWDFEQVCEKAKRELERR